MNEHKYPRIQVSQIPEHDRNELAKMALSVTEAVFSNPGEEERYQAWLAERKLRAMNR